MIDNQRIFILAEPRSGSSWLMETLNSHKDISLLSELYNHAMFPEVMGFRQVTGEKLPLCIEYLEKKLSEALNKYIGCKILLNQLDFISPDFPGYFIGHYREAYFIFLARENMVQAQVSLKLAHTHKTWHVKRGEKVERRTVRIDPRELYRNLERFKQQRDKISAQLENFRTKTVRLTYEELFADRTGSIDKMCALLDIPNHPVEFSSEIKGNPFDMKKTVENFAQVKDYLKKYPYYYDMLGPGR